ncbi:MAG: hypothetical protein JST28_09740 [Acidobacteria bacterium]|nr:hypothetical protein [Acidobacteriota bacterium]
MKIKRMMPDERGSILVTTSLCMVMFIAILGLAIDFGHFLFVKRNLQGAADAAALAAALEARSCNGTQVCTAMQSAAQGALQENGLSADTVLTNCSAGVQSGTTLTLNNPPCAVAGDPNKGKGTYAEAIVSQPVQTYFASLVGLKSVTVTARAEAAHGLGGPCIYALNPTGPALTILAGVIVKSRCPIVDESASAGALTCVVGAFLYAPRISVTGGTEGLLCLAASKPQTYQATPTPADPLAYLPAPSNANAACGTSTSSPYYGSSSAVNVLLGGDVTFNPGVYCGGISITAAIASNIKFNPGTYILKDGPGLLGITSGGLNLTLNLLTSIKGNGVTFYNAGSHGSLMVIEPVTGASYLSLSNVSLSAPTSGTYSGILFFQAHGITSNSVFVANLINDSKLEGAIYLPDGDVSYGVSAISSAYNILVAKDIHLNVAVGSVFGDDYSGLAEGSPLNGNNVTLVQ